MSKSNRKGQKTTSRPAENLESGTKKRPANRRSAPAFLARVLLDSIETRPSLFTASSNLIALLTESVRGRGKEYQELLVRERASVEETAMKMARQLLESDIDPHMFEVLFGNLVDRRLKRKFAPAFLACAVLFTLASYAIVVGNGIYEWNISEIAITALIIETPMQFIGLLYIIARNLFPQTTRSNREKRVSRTGTK